MSREIIILDTGSLVHLYTEGGEAAWDRLTRDPDRQLLVTGVVDDELTAGTNQDFVEAYRAWRDRLEDNQTLHVIDAIDIRSINDAGYTTSTGNPREFNIGGGDDAGEWSIRYLLEGRDPAASANFLDSADVVRVLTDDRPAFDNFTYNPNWPTPDAVSPSAELSALDYARGLISADDFNSEMSHFLDYLENSDSFRTPWAEQMRSAIGNADRVDILVDGMSAANVGAAFQTTKLLALGVGVVGLEALGVFSDIAAYAATSLQANELLEQGDVDGASRLWAEYTFETGGGILGASLGAYWGTAGGFWGSLAGGIGVGIVGSLGGNQIGGWLYDLDPEMFDAIIGGRLPENRITIGEGVDAIQWSYIEANDTWNGIPASSSGGNWPTVTVLERGDEGFEVFESQRLARIAFNDTVDLRYGLDPSARDNEPTPGGFFTDVFDRIFGNDYPALSEPVDDWLQEDFFSFGTNNFDDAYSFDIGTNFSNGSQQNSPTDFNEISWRIQNEGLLFDGGNWYVTSATANDPGFFVEINAAISDRFQPGRANVLAQTASDRINDVFELFAGSQSASNDYLNSRLGLAVGWSQALAEIDPLIIDIDGDGIELTWFGEHHILFDVDNDGNVERTGWVGPDDGMLVRDLSGDGKINDITEILSEYYSAAPGSGAIWTSAFEALQSLDANGDGEITSADAAWQDLRVWQDANSNGVTDGGELITLEQLNITALSLANVGDGSFLAGNEVKANGEYSLAGGGTRTLAAVNFTADPNGISESVDGQGIRFDLESGDAIYAVATDDGEDVNLGNLSAQHIFGGVGNDVLRGDAGDNWLLGSLGSDQLFGGAGNDYLIADAEDIETDQVNIDGGEGFDIVQFVGDRGVAFNLQDSRIEMAIGSDHADILSSGSSDQSIINGGLGNDLLIGGQADDVLNGEEGNDAVYGHSGNDLIRGHRGQDHLSGGSGNDIIQGGLGNDKLLGGDGEDLLNGGRGNDDLDGGEGYDVAQFSGSYADYAVNHNIDGTVTVRDHRANGDGVDTLRGVEALNFADINEVSVDLENPLPVKDSIRVILADDGAYRIPVSDLLANDLDYQGDALSVREVFDAKGGTVSIENDEIVFTPEIGFTGVPSFSYRVQDSNNNNGMQVGVVGTMQTAEMSARVILIREDMPYDPEFINQWYLPEVNVLPVWQDYNGAGVTVGVFEPGPWDAETYGKIDRNHPDLQSKFTADELRTDNPNIEPTQHATLVAGVISADRNDIGGVGVAYGATLTSKGITESDFNPLLEWADVDVANNSWGSGDLFQEVLINEENGEYVSVAVLQHAAYYGRDGLGSIVVFGAGNDRESGHDTNARDFTNSHYAVTVGAVNAEGDLGNLLVASDPFSNPGASILVSAPGSNVASTSRLVENENGSTFGGDYEVAQGTSFATPIVSGVIALMLEANPELGWRDVQEILALSAKQIDDPNTEWQINGATNWNGGGMHFSRDYGFGLVDARAAVRLAETWQEQKTSLNEYEIHADEAGFSITDGGIDADKVTTFISGSIDIENIEITLDIGHTRMGDLEITLISPTGTRSRLLDRPGFSPEDADGYDAYSGTWSLTSRHFRGEDSAGLWTLEVHDKVTGETGTINSWKLQAYGAADGDNDVYIYTDEFSQTASQNGRSVLSDSAGYDTINTSAVSGDVFIDLSRGKDSYLDGHWLSLLPGTEIERAYTGDGNDTVLGNASSNYLAGGKGDDTLYGDMGDDILVGGKGNDILYGSQGNDQFHWYQGDGNDTIEASVGIRRYAQGLGEDILILLDTRSDQVEIARSGYDIHLKILPTGEIITISDSFISSINYHSGELIDNYAVDFVYFENGETWTLGDLKAQSYFRGTDGEDTLYGSDGDDVFVGGKGDDILYGSDGDDVFLWAQGDGNDVIKARTTIPSYAAASGEDRLVFIDVTSDQVEVSRDGHDILLRVLVTDEIITLSESFITFIDNQTDQILDNKPVDLVTFSDGEMWNITELESRAYIRGTDGNDRLKGSLNNDIFWGGKGDDTFYGSDGDDTFLWAQGDGNDRIELVRRFPSTTNQAGGKDHLVLLDLTTVDVNLTRVSHSIELEILTTGEIITFSQNFTQLTIESTGQISDDRPIDYIDFSDGVTWNYDDILNNISLSGTDEDESIWGLPSNDELQGMQGNDVLYGGQGNDTYIYNLGDGNDKIWDGYGHNTLKFTDLNREDVIATSKDTAIEILIKSTGETIYLGRQFLFHSNHSDATHPAISQIEFANGTIWDQEDIAEFTFTRGTDGDDIINSSPFRGETVIAGLGNDTINAAHGGSDQIIYKSGDGNDIINADRNDKIVFSDLLMQDVIATRNGDDAEILIKPTGQIVTVIDGFSDDHGHSNNSFGLNHIIDFSGPGVEFSDGKITYIWELQGNTDLIGTSAGDYIISKVDGASLFGFSGGDFLHSWANSSKLFGGDGDDFLYGSYGNEDNRGSTEFHGGSGFDHFYGSQYSSDTYIVNLVDDGHYISNRRDIDGISLDRLIFGEGIEASDIEWRVGIIEDNLFMRVQSFDPAAISPIFLGIIDLFENDSNLVDQAINLDGLLVSYLLENLQTEGVTRASLLEVFGIEDQSTTLISIDSLNSAYDAQLSGKVLAVELVDWFVDPLAQLDEIQLFDGTVVEIPDHIKALQPGLIIGDGAVNDVLSGTSQSERIDGGGGDDTISALEGNDKIIGGQGNDTLNGGAGNDQLYGNDGDDIIDFGAGEDYATGHWGSDTFVFKSGYGADTIIDFEGGVGIGDVVEFQSSLAADYAALQTFMDDFSGPDTVIDFGNGDSLTLNETTLAELHADDFRFVA